MSRHSQRIGRLEARTSPIKPVTIIFWTVYSGGHGTPLVGHAQGAHVIGVGRFTRPDDEPKDAFRRRMSMIAEGRRAGTTHTIRLSEAQ